MNKILAGDYSNGVVVESIKDKCLIIDCSSFFTKKVIPLTKKTVAFYEVVDEQSKKSFSSGVVRGAVGAAVLGPLGGIAGVASAKNKNKHTVSVQFKDGRSTLLELDDRYYKILVTSLY